MRNDDLFCFLLQRCFSSPIIFTKYLSSTSSFHAHTVYICFFLIPPLTDCSCSFFSLLGMGLPQPVPFIITSHAKNSFHLHRFLQALIAPSNVLLLAYNRVHFKFRTQASIHGTSILDSFCFPSRSWYLLLVCLAYVDMLDRHHFFCLPALG